MHPALHEEHTLGDGTRVTIRFIQPADGAELRRCFALLSPRSRYQRFLSALDLTDERIDYLTNVDGERHVAIVCTTESHDLKSELGLGVGRFVRLDEDETGVAEAAITVLDDMQGKGIGRLLMRVLATLAITRGVRVFRCEVLADNARMRHLLEDVGATARAAEDSAVMPTLVFDVPLQGPVDKLEKEPSNPLRRLLRMVAEEIRKLPHPPT